MKRKIANLTNIANSKRAKIFLEFKDLPSEIILHILSYHILEIYYHTKVHPCSLFYGIISSNNQSCRKIDSIFSNVIYHDRNFQYIPQKIKYFAGLYHFSGHTNNTSIATLFNALPVCKYISLGIPNVFADFTISIPSNEKLKVLKIKANKLTPCNINFELMKLRALETNCYLTYASTTSLMSSNISKLTFLHSEVLITALYFTSDGFKLPPSVLSLKLIITAEFYKNNFDWFLENCQQLHSLKIVFERKSLIRTYKYQFDELFAKTTTLKKFSVGFLNKDTEYINVVTDHIHLLSNLKKLRLKGFMYQDSIKISRHPTLQIVDTDLPISLVNQIFENPTLVSKASDWMKSGDFDYADDDDDDESEDDE